MQSACYRQTHEFPEAVHVGCMQLDLVNCPSVPEFFSHANEGVAGARIGAMDAFVMLSTVRLPEGREEFDRQIEMFTERGVRKKLKLPDGVVFGPEHLAVAGLEYMEHACFALGKRDVFHVYTGDALGILVRFRAAKGTMLDQPVFVEFLKSVRFVDAWQAGDPPFPVRKDLPDPEPIPAVHFIDLAADHKAVSEYVRSRVEAFAQSEHLGPGEDGQPVRQVTLGFQYDQAGWTQIVFDTRPEAGFDGEWTVHLNDLFDRQHWYHASETLCESDEPLAITTDTGATVVLSEQDEDRMAEIIGSMLTNVLEDARDTGVLAGLPLADAVQLVVCDFDEEYVWQWKGTPSLRG